MRISKQKHSFETFIDELIRDVEPGKRLRVVCYFAHHGDWETESYQIPSLRSILISNAVEITELGDIKRLVAHYRDFQTNQLVRVVFFAFLHPDTGLLMCFTNNAKKDVEQTLDKIVEKNPGLYFAFIDPLTLDKIQSMLFETHPSALVTYFSAYRNRRFSLKGDIRPDYERTIEYRALDGKKVLEELRHSYGVLPRSIHFEIPEFATYYIHSIGHFTLAKGEESARRFLLEIADFAMKETLLTRRTVESADFQLIPIETKRKTFLFPKLKPWIIKFSGPINIQAGHDLVDILEENSYDTFNYVLTEGSLRFNGLITDRLKGSIFTIDSNAERMVIAPLGEVPFDSFLRFYRTLVENFDPKASCLAFE